MVKGQSKYETHVKPFLNDIREMLDKGAYARDIQKALGISQNIWADAKKNEPEFMALFDQTKKIKANLEKAKLDYDELPSYTTLARMLIKCIEDNPTVDNILKVAKQLYPQNNHWIQLEYEKIKVQRELHNKDIENSYSENNKLKAIDDKLDILLEGGVDLSNELD